MQLAVRPITEERQHHVHCRSSGGCSIATTVYIYSWMNGERTISSSGFHPVDCRHQVMSKAPSWYWPLSSLLLASRFVGYLREIPAEIRHIIIQLDGGQDSLLLLSCLLKCFPKSLLLSLPCFFNVIESFDNVFFSFSSSVCPCFLLEVVQRDSHGLEVLPDAVSLEK